MERPLNPAARGLGLAGADAAIPRGAWWAGLLLLMAALAAWLAAQPPAALAWAERAWHDRLLHAGATRPPPAELVLVQIDERSLQQLGPWPWPRPVLAQLVQRLRDAGARLQVWDLLLPEPAEGDPVLAAQLAHGDVVLGQALVLDPDIDVPPTEGRLALSPAPPDLCSQSPLPRGHLGLAASLGAVGAGHINATPDPDGRLRRLPAVICDALGQRHPQLALAAAAADEPRQAWQRIPGQGWLEPAQWLQRGRWRFALDAEGWLPVPYQRPHHAWPAISAAALLVADAPAAAGPDLRGRVVLVGATALGVGDVAATPLHSHAPGVSVHAEVIAQGLVAGATAAWPGGQPRARVVLAALTAALAGGVLLLLASWLLPGGAVAAAAGSPWRRAWLPAGLLGVALALAVPLGVAWLAHRAGGGVLWPTAAPMAAVLVAAIIGTVALLLRQRQHLHRLEQALHSFVPPALARQIARQAAHGGSLGHPQEGCLLGIHVQGLHAWVSQADTLQALALVHALHATIQRAAHEHGGSVEHAQDGRYYLGWPQRQPPCAAAALACARALHRQLQPLLQANEQPRYPLSVWMALDCGHYLLGLVGGDAGRRGVLLGPLANEVAALLELAPELAVPIVVAPAAESLLRQDPTLPCGLRSLGSFRLPDRSAPQELWWCAP